MNRSSAGWLTISGLVLGALACSSSQSNDSPSSPCLNTIDRFKELIVVEPSVVEDARARNDVAGPWSFRYAVEQMVPSATSPSAFIDAWLNEWSVDSVNGFRVDRPGEDRAARVQVSLACPWLKRTSSNACDDKCKACAHREFDLAVAPFRLIAIVNRMDLRTQADATSTAGESRFVFALTEGPADDPASKPLQMTVIFEYALPVLDTLAPKDWAARWHALSSHKGFDDAYRSDLEALTRGFAERSASPSHGSALSQVRTNESAFDWFWQFREFRFDAGGMLRLSPVANTPDPSLNGSKALTDYVSANAAAITADKYVIGRALLGGSSDLFDAHWHVPGVTEPVRRAFAQHTCNGCHSGENPTVDAAFHVSPFQSGVARLSPFLNDPADPSHDELAHRAALASELLCGTP